MRAKRGWVLAAALSLFAAGGVRAQTIQSPDKLDPERPVTGSAPFAADHMDTYTTGQLIAYVKIFQDGNAAEQAQAAAIASFLSQTDANWRVSAAGQALNGMKVTPATPRRRLRNVAALSQTDVATPAPTPAATPAATPTGTATVLPKVKAATAPTPTPTVPVADVPAEEIVQAPAPTPTPPVRRSDWYAVAQDQMRSFWEADRDMPGAAPKGKIYDPKTGLLVSLDDHTKQVGMSQSFVDELANTSSGAGAGTMKRIKDK